LRGPGVNKPEEWEPSKGDGNSKTRIRRPAAGAHGGPAQLFSGFRHAPPGATFRRPFGTQTILLSSAFPMLNGSRKIR